MKVRRGSWVIALIFLYHLIIEGGGWLAPLFGRFTPGKETRYPLYRRLRGAQGWSGRVRKISPSPGVDPRTDDSVASRCTDWAILAHPPLHYHSNHVILWGRVKEWIEKSNGKCSGKSPHTAAPSCGLTLCSPAGLKSATRGFSQLLAVACCGLHRRYFAVVARLFNAFVPVRMCQCMRVRYFAMVARLFSAFVPVRMCQCMRVRYFAMVARLWMLRVRTHASAMIEV
jgi:hypothetical protein